MKNFLNNEKTRFVEATLAIIGACVIVYLSESSLYMKKGAYESTDSIIEVNKNFRDSGRIIPSYEAALKYKIISDQSLNNRFMKKYVHFYFSENSMDTLIDKNDENVCQKVITRLAKEYKDNDPTDILINGIPLKETVRSQSNIDYACSQNDSVSIKNILK